MVVPGESGKRNEDWRGLCRLTAVVLAALGLPLGIFSLMSFAGEMAQIDPPLTVPGAPFGTDYQPTMLGLGLLATGTALGLLATAMAGIGLVATLRGHSGRGWEWLAGGLFIASALTALVPSLVRVLTRAHDPAGFIMGFFIGMLPGLVVGVLFLIGTGKPLPFARTGGTQPA